MNSPITIDGALSRMSLMKRMTLEIFSWRPYSARYVPARMPIGVPMATASAVSTRLPMIGLSRPPACPGGGVISVNTASDSPPKPFPNRTPRIPTGQRRPSRLAASARTCAVELLRRRAAYKLEFMLCAMMLTDPPFDAGEQEAGDREHDEGDDEQDEPERDQRRRVEIADCLGELVGDGG